MGSRAILVSWFSLAKEGHQDCHVRGTLHVVDHVRINWNEDAGTQLMLLAPKAKSSFPGKCLNRDRNPGRMVSQEDPPSQLDKHQLSPPIGQEDLYLSVFSLSNFVRQDNRIAHNHASSLHVQRHLVRGVCTSVPVSFLHY
jgi:hypothetical protein